MANFCLDFETEEEEANVSFISPKENLLCNDSEVPLKSTVHPYHLPSPLPTFHQHGVVISADKNRSVVLPYGGWEDDGVFIIENNASGATVSSYSNIIPISTILDIFEWKEFNGKAEKTYKQIKGVITRYEIIEKADVKKQTVICTKTTGCSFFVAVNNEEIEIEKSFVSDAPKPGNIYVMTSIKVKSPFCHHLFSNSYIPAAQCSFASTTNDIIQHLEHFKQHNVKGLVIGSDSKENWITLGKIIIAGSHVLAAKCKREVTMSKIEGTITEATIKDKTVLRFTISQLKEKKQIALLQHNYFSVSSTAVLLQPNHCELKLRVAGSSFSDRETSITFDSSYELFRKSYPTTPNHCINEMQVQIQSTPNGDFFSTFGKKVLYQKLPIFDPNASTESRLIFNGLFGIPITVEVPENDETFYGSILDNATEEQAFILKRVAGGNSVLNLIESSAGSGKTIMICKLIEYYSSQNPVKLILATTHSNAPGFDIGTKIQNFCHDILIICSKSALKKLDVNNTRLIEKFGLKKRFSEALQHPDLPATQKKILTEAKHIIFNDDDAESNRCTTLFENCNNGTTDQISQCITIILEILEIKVLISTLSMATRHSSAIADHVEFCLVDEAGTIPQIVAASFVAELPNLKKLILVGDTKQHNGFDITMPEIMINFGYESEG
uniref:DNA2/NAM7 helicase helicase domain-containing protein n=1 Tax=Panagrolaimus superbus TaxID=310955 RepID=A0A914YXK8_9BILA